MVLIANAVQGLTLLLAQEFLMILENTLKLEFLCNSCHVVQLEKNRQLMNFILMNF